MFHRVEEIEEIPASKFFPRARRLISYKGALRFTAEQEAEKGKQSHAGTKTYDEAPKRFDKIEQNTEAFNLNIIEGAKG